MMDRPPPPIMAMIVTKPTLQTRTILNANHIFTGGEVGGCDKELIKTGGDSRSTPFKVKNWEYCAV